MLFRSLAGPLPGKCDASVAQIESSKEISHEAWEKLLKKYVDPEGLVDYKNFGKEAVQLDSYLNYLGSHVPGQDAAREVKLAYYINLYNAATVKLILDNYPIKSIRDIEDPWDAKWIPQGSGKISLGDIEHNILRKMEEPRIHFAINCASYSCPKLSDEAYTSTGIYRQLEEATKDFIRDPARNNITDNTLELSQIFNWYKGDFSVGGNLVDFISPYIETTINPGAKISFKKYDWSLNETR